MDDTGRTEQEGRWLVVVGGGCWGCCRCCWGMYIGRRPFLHSSDCFHILKFDRELFCAVGWSLTTEYTFCTIRLIEIYKSTF